MFHIKVDHQLHGCDDKKTDKILESLFLINRKLNTIIMKQAEMLAALEEADAATNEIAADIQVLIDQGAVSEEVAAKLTAHVDKLKGIAAER